MTAYRCGGNRARDLALLFVYLALPFSTIHPASAQDWPARNVTVVVPLGAGSASDIMARVVSDQLSRQLNRTFVVENRPGAGGTVGAAAVARSAPDGYTVLAYGALSTANALYSKLAYDTLNDFVPVIAFGIQPLVIVSSPEKGYKTLADLIAAGKAKPGSLNYSSAGAGSASHFAGERLRVSAGIQAQHVTYQRRRRGGDRGRRRPHRFQPATAGNHGTADQRRQARGARGQRAQAHRHAAQCADHHRSRPLRRIRSIRSTAACSCRRRRRARSSTSCTRKPPRRSRRRKYRRVSPSSASSRCR